MTKNITWVRMLETDVLQRGSSEEPAKTGEEQAKIGIFIESSDMETPTENPRDHPDVRIISAEDVP